MLNRLYIAVGAVIILILSGAFIAPLLIDWERYRGRLEAIAEQGFGASVAIRGGAEFRLLPQPRMVFDDVVIGPLNQPLASVRRIQADFKLMPFLRDRFELSKLTMVGPRLSTNISSEGEVFLPFTLPEAARDAVIKIEAFSIEDGRIVLYDGRRDEAMHLTRINGTATIGDLYGPYSFSGDVAYEGQPFALRLNVGAIGAQGDVSLNMFVQPSHGQYSLNSSGKIEQRDGQPVYTGDVAWRTHVAEGEAPGEHGARIVEASIELSGQGLALSELVLVPDDQRPATRLSGSASMRFGRDPAFELDLAGGVVALKPRDIRNRADVETPELILLLEELPPLPSPSMAGRIRLALAELDLHGVAVRDLRLDATTSGGDWRIQELVGSLPGQSAFLARGTVGNVGEHLSFAGRLDGESSHIDGLARLWRHQVSSPALVGAPASLRADLTLSRNGISLKNAALFLQHSSVDFDMSMRLGSNAGFALDLRAQMLERSDGEVLAALFQGNGDLSGYRAKLDQGKIDISLGTAQINDLALEDIDVHGGWNGDGAYLTALKAGNVAGLSVDLSGDLLVAPDRLVGQFSGSVTGRDGLDLALIFQTLQSQLFNAEQLGLVNRFAPFNGRLEIAANEADGTPNFVFGLDGAARGARIALSGEFAGDLSDLAGGEAKLFMLAKHENVAALQTIFGLDSGFGPIIAGTAQGLIDLQLEGNLGTGAQLGLRLESVAERLSIVGKLKRQDDMFQLAEASYDVALTNGAPLLAFAGANDLPAFPLVAKGKLAFGADQMLELADLTLSVGGQSITGNLSLPFGHGDGRISGRLKFDEIEISEILHAIVGAPALIEGPDFWPVGPLSVGTTSFGHRGSVHIESDVLALNLSQVVEQAGFDLGWSDSAVSIEGFEGKYGGGMLGMSVTLCCTGSNADVGLTGRVRARDVRLDALLPANGQTGVDGVLSFDGKIESSGPSIEALMGRLGGEGVFSVADLEVAQFSPGVFAEAALIENVSDISEARLEQQILDYVAAGSFAGDQVEGAFAASNGKIRVRNLAIDAQATRLLGDMRFDLADFNLEGNWAMSARETGETSDGAVFGNTAQVNARFDGPIGVLETKIDVSALSDAVRVRALAVEIDRLEKLRAEQEARDAERRVIEAERARLAREIQQQAAAAIAVKAAEREAAVAAQRVIAAQQAAQKAAKELAADQAAAAQSGFDHNGQAVGLDNFE